MARESADASGHKRAPAGRAHGHTGKHHIVRADPRLGGAVANLSAGVLLVAGPAPKTGTWLPSVRAARLDPAPVRLASALSSREFRQQDPGRRALAGQDVQRWREGRRPGIAPLVRSQLVAVPQRGRVRHQHLGLQQAAQGVDGRCQPGGVSDGGDELVACGRTAGQPEGGPGHHELVQAGGEIVHTGFDRFAGASTARLSRTGVGPSLSGLIAPSNYGPLCGCFSASIVRSPWTATDRRWIAPSVR